VTLPEEEGKKLTSEDLLFGASYPLSEEGLRWVRLIHTTLPTESGGPASSF